MNQSYARDFLGEMSPAGQRASQALSPYQQFRVSGTVRPPNQPAYGDPLAALNQLDPASDSFLDDQQVIFEGNEQALDNPAVQRTLRNAASQHAEAQGYFKRDPSLAEFYAQQRGKNIPPQQALSALRNKAMDNSIREGFIKAGGLDEEYEALRDPATGIVDRFKAMSFLNKFERDARKKVAAAPKELPPEAYARLDKARYDVDDLMSISTNPSRLADYYKSKTKKDLVSGKKDNTDEALRMVSAELNAARELYERNKRSYGTRYALPPEFDGQPVEEVSEEVVEEAPSGTGIAAGVESIVPSLTGTVATPVEQPAPSGYVQPAPAATPSVMPPAKTVGAPLSASEWLKRQRKTP